MVDLGSGTGTLLEDLSLAVGPRGRVIAEDIHPDFLDRARERAQSSGLSNIDFVLGTDVGPKLPAGSAGLVVVLDAYHHFDYPERMLDAIKRALRPGGRLAIVEYHKKRGAMEVDDPDFALNHIRASVEQVTREIETAGFKLLWLVSTHPASSTLPCSNYRRSACASFPLESASSSLSPWLATSISRH